MAPRLPRALQRNWEWQVDAACREVDARIFFHPPGERGAEYEARDQAAKTVCERCAVREPCLRFALDTHEPYGVWGGLTVEERLGHGPAELLPEVIEGDTVDSRLQSRPSSVP
ncbi:WhiB family transcriptional regulator [Streptacidiphilus albus]|uniref:WhiB family transcriptional regulator n=1 Tax=Streptacidiphilus albus TaxID=105425 RepID=UPI0007C7C21F|nr:WhiB family transcriptional regulator [Streptacidiphilus albus]